MKTTLFRNTLAVMAALFTALFALPQKAGAEVYDLKIAGTKVTSANCDDLSVIPGVTGTAKYNPSTKTLILENATINATGNNNGIEGNTDGLTVLVKGTVNVTVQGTSAIGFRKEATLTGGGTLNATSGTDCALLANKADLTLDGLTVNAKGRWGISGQPSEPKTLTIRNANVTAEGDGTEASFCDFETITFDGCEILQPEDAAFDAWIRGVAIYGQLVKEKVVIKAAATSYGLYVAGTQVTSANCADLTVISGVTGTAYYDHSTQTLTLDNAAINAPGTESCIVGETDGLTVRVKGTVNLTSPNGNTLAFLRNATLTGDGTLNVTSKRKCGIFIQQDLTIKDCTANVKGAWGIAGGNGSAETLAIRNATVTAEGTNGSVCNLKALTLDGNLIIQPTGAAFNASLKGVALGGQLVKTKVTIGKPVEATPYELHIAGTQVTSLNAADLTAIPGVTGTVKYDPTTKTLTLEDAAINSNTKTAIMGDIDGLTIQVKGTVSVTAKSNSALRLTRPATITGGGTLNATSPGDCGIYVYQTRLTIDGTTVHAKGEYGIAGEHGHSETLTVKNATVTAECDGTEGSIIAIKALVLDGCAITTPAGAAFDASLKGVALNGQLVKEKVEIAPAPNAIDAPRASEAGAKRTGTYTLRGVKTDAPLESLPAGVYIYNGKKVVKQ